MVLCNLPWERRDSCLSLRSSDSLQCTAQHTPHRVPRPDDKQLIWVCIGMFVLFLALIPDYHTVGRYAYILYALSLVLRSL